MIKKIIEEHKLRNERLELWKNLSTCAEMLKDLHEKIKELEIELVQPNQSEMVVSLYNILDSKEYEDELERYLSEGINYNANTISNANEDDLKQLSSDSFYYGVYFALNEVQKRKLLK